MDLIKRYTPVILNALVGLDPDMPVLCDFFLFLHRAIKSCTYPNLVLTRHHRNFSSAVNLELCTALFAKCYHLLVKSVQAPSSGRYGLLQAVLLLAVSRILQVFPLSAISRTIAAIDVLSAYEVSNVVMMHGVPAHTADYLEPAQHRHFPSGS